MTIRDYKLLFVFLMLMFLGSCGSVTRVVVLQNKDTKQIAECRVDPWGSANRRAQINDCIKAYEKAGYKVIGDSE